MPSAITLNAMTVSSDVAHDVPSPTRPPLHVIVVDDHPIYRQGIVRALRVAGEIVDAEEGNGTIALSRIREVEPDVALVDVRMPGLDGIDIIAALARHGPDVPVVLLSAFGDEPLIRAGFEAGAAAYLTKDADREFILRAVRAAAGAERSPRALSGAGRDLIASPRYTWVPRLTGMEYRLLTLAYEDLDKIAMGEQLGLDEGQVRRVAGSAIGKLGADTLADALQIAERAAILVRIRPATGA
jgi:two-component system nitrate/nitrite response regulator NarL